MTSFATVGFDVISSATMEKAAQSELRLAGRMSRLGTETAFEVLNKARALERQGKEIIHLEIGEPDFDTPKNIVDAAVEALRKGWTHYGPSAGLPELRQAIAQSVSRSREVEVTSDEVVVVPGGKPIIFFSLLAISFSGDNAILAVLMAASGGIAIGAMIFLSFRRSR